MRHGVLLRRVGLVLLAFAMVGAPVEARIVYVDAAADAGGDGSSWLLAWRHLRDALDAALVDNTIDEIRVAQGVYRPDRGTFNPSARFQIAGDYAVKGGYAGVAEPEPDTRDSALYATTLSGDLLGNDGANYQNYFDNARVIVEFLPGTGAPELSGVTVRAAREHGIVVAGANPEIRDCRVTLNYTVGSGAGLHITADSEALIDRCTFAQNRADLQGGGMLLGGEAVVTVEHSVFLGNLAATSSEPGQLGGAGVFLDYGDAAGASTFFNCLFVANEVFYGQGAAFYAYGSAIEMANCSLVRNWHWGGGTAGLYVEGVDPSPERQTQTVSNTLFWANGFGEEAQLQFVDAVIGINHCIVQDWTGALGGMGNSGADPLLALIGPPGSLTHDAHLLPGSPCIDAGDNSALPPTITEDLDGNPRFLDDTVTPDVGVGTPPVVDIGAYEFQAESDCNSNGIRDNLDIAGGTARDCNANGRPDVCDLADGVSEDADSNGVPDECAECQINADCSNGLFCDGVEICVEGECAGGAPPCTGAKLCNESLDACLPDCNQNGIDDATDIAQGYSADCNTSGVPDECELAPVRTLIDVDFENGLPANWSADGLWHVSAACVQPFAPDPPYWAYFGRDDACDFDTGAIVSGSLASGAVQIPANATSAVLTYASFYEGDRGFASIPFGFDLAWVEVDGALVDDVGPTPGYGAWEIREVDLAAFVGAAVTLSWRFDSVDAISNDAIGWAVDAVQLVTTVANDCNANGVPDDCEDCNGNGLADECDLASGASADCDANGVPDECDVLLEDCNANGVPDPCDPDLDDDGIPDDCDDDRDGDDVPDDVDLCVSVPGEPVNPAGGPMGDFNDDCTVNAGDHYYYSVCLSLSGPATPPAFDECREVFDFDVDGDVDLVDFGWFQRAAE